MQAQELKNKFSLATDLLNQGKPDLALKIWDQLSSQDFRELPGFDVDVFLAEVSLYKAWTLMDMEAYDRALNVLESMFLKSCLPQFNPETQFDYYFSYGNAAAELKEKEKMENAFVEAMKLAKEKDETEKITRCWLHLLYYSEINGWWKYLEQAARTCIVFAESSNNASLGLSAGLRRACALANLGKVKRAEIQAKRIIQVAIQFNENEALDKAQEFLNSLEDRNIETSS